MYWTTAKRQLLKISEMTTDHLNNCKNMLERNDIRINTLSKTADYYSKTYCEPYLDEDDYRVFVEYIYTDSQEYYNICKELEYRSQQ